MILAVYGTLKKGFPNHHFLGDSPFIGNYITEPQYTMYSLGGFPAITLGGDTAIYTEMYDVKSFKDLRNIFMLEGYKPGRERNMYELHMFTSPFGDAGIFVMENVNNHYKQIKSGIWTSDVLRVVH